MTARLVALFFLLATDFSYASSPDSLSFFEKATKPNRGRIRAFKYTVGVVYPASVVYLYSEWYKPYSTSNFHFFNDNAEWEGMDKYAHATGTYAIAKLLMRTLQWAGEPDRKAMWIGTALSYSFLTTIEVFDGFSDKWGFSWGDAGANTFGAALFVGQEYLWKEQRISLKGSFHKSKYAQYRPTLLGEGFPSTTIKDYNGMTYWVNVSPHMFFKNSGWPPWLRLSFGVGAEGMTGGSENPTEVDGTPIPSFDRYKQYYLSVDIHLSKIETRSKTLNNILDFISILRIPTPAIEFNNGHKTKFYPLYF